MRVAYLQTNPRFLKVEENLSRLERALGGISADLIVLPELCTSGYNFRNRKEVARVAEPFSAGPSLARLQAYARKKDCALVAGFAEKSGNRFYNSAAFITPTQRKLYRKTHLFGREKLFFAPGDTGFSVFQWKGVRIGVMVCFDWFFPEASRTLAAKGAQVIAHPANLVLPYCPEAMKTRSLENRVFSITCDRVGREFGVSYIGRSQIVDPWGKVLSRASATREETYACKIDPQLAASKRLNRFNDLLKDRRPQLYR